MTPDEFYEAVIVPGMAKVAKFAPQLPDNRSVRVMLMAVAGLESDWSNRDGGGLFKIDLGCVNGLLAHADTEVLLDAALDEFGIIDKTPQHLFDLLGNDQGDILCLAMARLVLWSDPDPFPAYDDQASMFAYYQSHWFGLGAATRWPDVYGQSLAAVPAE
jgi:hypothetical protein